ncbi:hypothetical protein HKX48_003078, partial [Thoreauomyces humboldtii]
TAATTTATATPSIRRRWWWWWWSAVGPGDQETQVGRDGGRDVDVGSTCQEETK